MHLSWDEAKRIANLQKHGLDFAQANELRVLSISYVLGMLAVLVVVHTERGESLRIISFRRASREEREVYYEWLENECDEP